MILVACRALIAVGRAIVPVAFRDDWSREWQAELYYRAETHAPSGLGAAQRFDLLKRCAGALVQALWLRKEEWSMTVLLQDVRYAIRSLRLRMGFTAVCVLILALGIGANAAVFSVVNGVLLRPLPYRDPDRLVQIWETNPAMNWTTATVAPANLLDWRERNQSFEDFAYYLGADGKGPHVGDATLSGFGDPERVRSMVVSGNFFALLGVEAAVGRVLRPSDARAGEARVVVISDGFWRRRFGGDASIVGRRVDLDGVPAEIAGVMGRRFHVPGAEVDYWEPHRMDEARMRRMRRAHWFRVVARLEPGVTIDSARADMTGIAAALERQYPDTNTRMGVGLGPLHDWYVGDVRRALLMLMAAVGVVLLITCTNVASLLLARATSRRREIAIRVAIGAGRIRLIRQLLTESLVLAGGAGLLGVFVTWLALTALQQAAPAGLPRLDQIGIDGRVLLFVAGSVIVTALIFGLAPAFQSARNSSTAMLKDGGRTATSEGVGLRRALIVAEVALSVVLLVGAGLLIRSLLRLQSVDPGIDATQALSFKVTIPDRYDDEKAARYFSEAITRLAALPGVTAAGATGKLPLEGYSWTGDLFVEGRPDIWGRDLRHKSITPGYLRAAGIRLIAGRDFGSEDTAAGPRVTIVNQTLARRFFGDTPPVGKRIAYSRPSASTMWTTIVGVVADEKQDGLAADVQPEVYAPHTQDTRNAMSLIVRTAVRPVSLLPLVRREMTAVDAAVALYDIRTLGQVVERSLAEERFSTALLGAFALTALLLAVIGLYGIVAFAVTSRTREIGVRLALGASRQHVLRMVVWDGVRVVLMGVAAGLLVALAIGRGIESFLFQTPPTDPLVLVAVAAALTAAGACASYLPAWRASRVDPVESLRVE
jgi:putative ABC transport system permease protein